MLAGREQTITVDRLKLIEQLKKNLAQHIQDYEEAKIGYRIKLKKDLEDALEWFDEQPYKNIEKIEIRSNPPRSYAKEFEDAILRAEWMTTDTVQLDNTTFKQYIQNEWSWSSTFDVLNSTYKSFAAGAALGG